jgi:hypothetical protein
MRSLLLATILVSCASSNGAHRCSCCGPGHGDKPVPTGNVSPAPVAQPRPAEPEPGGGAAQGKACEDGKCQAGLSCVKFYGIAGRSGPLFTSCEIPCGPPEFACPAGQVCGTIADGPGQVCRPRRPAPQPPP